MAMVHYECELLDGAVLILQYEELRRVATDEGGEVDAGHAAFHLDEIPVVAGGAVDELPPVVGILLPDGDEDLGRREDGLEKRFEEGVDLAPALVLLPPVDSSLDVGVADGEAVDGENIDAGPRLSVLGPDRGVAGVCDVAIPGLGRVEGRVVPQGREDGLR